MVHFPARLGGYLCDILRSYFYRDTEFSSWYILLYHYEIVSSLFCEFMGLLRCLLIWRLLTIYEFYFVVFSMMGEFSGYRDILSYILTVISSDSSNNIRRVPTGIWKIQNRINHNQFENSINQTLENSALSSSQPPPRQNHCSNQIHSKVLFSLKANRYQISHSKNEIKSALYCVQEQRNWHKMKIKRIKDKKKNKQKLDIFLGWKMRKYKLIK